ncbi:MAG: ABC transporter permease [Planctomycetes bacterium]|nr:ABC transporter permease [Planctomycetota bacterium]
MANKTLLVAQREYLDNVRTKTFWLGILAFPAIFVVALGIGWVMQKTKQTQSYTVADFTESKIGGEIERAARASTLADFLRAELDKIPKDSEYYRDPQVVAVREHPELLEQGLQAMPEAMRAQLQARLQDAKAKYRYRSPDELGVAGLEREQMMAALNQRVRDGELFAYFVFDKDPVASLDGLAYVSENQTDNELGNWYSRVATRIIQQQRIQQANIPAATARHIREEVDFRPTKPGAGAEIETVTKEEKANKFAPVAFVYLLWIAVFTAAQMLLTNTVEEKSNRIIEVLLSSVSPGELMSGKIWGIGLTGLTIVGSWVVFGVIGVWLAPKLVPSFAELNLLAIVGDPLYIASFLGYFLTGYLLFAAMLVAIGSVCNSLKEAQNLLQPVFLLLMLPLFAMIPIVQEPNGLMARVFTYIPIYTPFAMMNRASGPPPAVEYVVTTALILVSLFVAFKAAGRIFRVGVLMTGNPPKLKEILSWLREK